MRAMFGLPQWPVLPQRMHCKSPSVLAALGLHGSVHSRRDIGDLVLRMRLNSCGILGIQYKISLFSFVVWFGPHSIHISFNPEFIASQVVKDLKQLTLFNNLYRLITFCVQLTISSDKIQFRACIQILFMTTMLLTGYIYSVECVECKSGFVLAGSVSSTFPSSFWDQVLLSAIILEWNVEDDELLPFDENFLECREAIGAPLYNCPSKNCWSLNKGESPWPRTQPNSAEDECMNIFERWYSFQSVPSTLVTGMAVSRKTRP